MSTDVLPGDEACQQNVNLYDESKGSCHSTRMSMIADPTTGLQVHIFVRQNTTLNLDHFDTDEKENQLFQASYPRSEKDYAIISPWEVMAISVLTTGLSPSLRKSEKLEYCNTRSGINYYRQHNCVSILPVGLFNQVSPILQPTYQCTLPSTSPIEDYHNNLHEYKEDLHLVNIEIEVIEGITTNKV